MNPSMESGVSPVADAPVRRFVVREWHGRVPSSRSDEYLRLMETVAIPDYRSVEGNLGAYCWHRRTGDIVHVAMVSWWRDLDCIHAFAGADISIAKYYPFDAAFLLEMAPRVRHYEGMGSHS